MINLLGAIFLGWSLGANDAANVFGTAVSSKMLKFWTAAILASIFVLVGALLQGQYTIETLQGLTPLTPKFAVITSFAAAIACTIMTFLGLPISTSQAVVGAIFGIGLINRNINLEGIGKVVICWVGTPIGAMVISMGIYRLLGAIYNELKLNIFQGDIFIRIGLILAGCYGAYALGANNVANVTAVFVGAGLLTVFSAALIGGLSIASGIMTFSRRVMETVGTKLIKLDPFSALVVILAEAITVHFYTYVGVPVSTSQAVIGAVLGVGIVKGINIVERKTLVFIVMGWLFTPVVALLFALTLDFISHLRYVG
ncbi:MAG: inorganic phosphate transporter [Desulfatiglandales bacterium]